MVITVKLYADSDKDHLTVEHEISEILKKTSDYQHGDITLRSDSIIVAGDCVDVNFYISDCDDIGHTRSTFDEFCQYLKKEFL